MEIVKDIFYTGVNDREIDLFEGQYAVPEGITYNSYVILDEKTALMDTVDAGKTEEWLMNVKQVLAGREPDYLVISHMEPDHAGSIAAAVSAFPGMKLVGNARTFTILTQFFDFPVEDKKYVVAEGDTLSLGHHSLQFFLAPMVHWPEVMVTYEQTEGVLFSADAFGKFGAIDGQPNETENGENARVCGIDRVKMTSLSKQPDNSVITQSWVDEARRYYCNIVGKYGVQVQGLLKKAAGLSIRVIAPLHGPVLTENLDFYIDKYNTWSTWQPEEEGVLIAFASIYGNTAKAADRLAELLREKGEKVKVLDLARSDMAEALAQAFRFDRLVLAASTYDGGLFPFMEHFLMRLKAKSLQKRTVGLIENGTWGPMSGKHMRTYLESMKEITIAEPQVTLRSAMKEETEVQLTALAEALTGV